MRWTRRRLAWLALLSLLPGCEEDPPGAHGFRVFSEGGVPVALTTGGPRWTGEIFDFELHLCLQEDEEDASTLYKPSGFDVDDRGWFYVADDGNDRIAVFDSAGRYVRAMGRSGEGPGELDWIQAPELLEGVLSVLDRSLSRITRFATDGTLLDIRPVALDELITTAQAYWDLKGGRGLLLRLERRGREEDMGEDARAALVALDREGDTLWGHRTPWEPLLTLEWMEFEGSRLPVPTAIPWAGLPTADYHPDHGILVSPGTGPHLHLLGEAGDTLLRIRVEISPEAPTEADLEEAESAVRASIREFDEPLFGALHGAHLSALTHPPEFKAPWTEVHLDDAGFVWLRLPDLRDYSSEPAPLRFRVLSPEGEYLGITTTPEASWVRPSRGRLLVESADSLTGVPKLCAYTIRPRVEGLAYPGPGGPGDIQPP